MSNKGVGVIRRTTSIVVAALAALAGLAAVSSSALAVAEQATPQVEEVTLAPEAEPLSEPLTSASGVAVTVTPELRERVGASHEATDKEVADEWGNYVVAQLSDHEKDVLRSGGPLSIVADPVTHQYQSVSRAMVQPQAIIVAPVSSCTSGVSRSCLQRYPLYMTAIAVTGDNGTVVGTWHNVKTIQSASNRRLTFGYANPRVYNTLGFGQQISWVQPLTVNELRHHS